MGCPPGDDQYERDERTLDVVFWLLPIGAAALGLVPFVLVAVVVFGWDGTGAGPGLVGLAAAATVVLVTRRVVAQRRREAAHAYTVCRSRPSQ